MEGFLARPAEQSVSPFWPLPERPDRRVGHRPGLRGARCAGSRTRPTAGRRRARRRAPTTSASPAARSASPSSRPTSPGSRFQRRPTRLGPLGAEVVRIGQEHGYALLDDARVVLLGGHRHPDRARPGVPRAGRGDAARHGPGGLRRLQPGGARRAASTPHGDVDAAHDLVGQALQVVQKTGEELHLPDLLRQRAAYALARGGAARRRGLPTWRPPRGRHRAGRPRRRGCGPRWRWPSCRLPARGLARGARGGAGRRCRGPCPPRTPRPPTRCSRERTARVVVLGGGMAGLVTAWELTRGEWRERPRVRHRLPAGLAARRQGREQPRALRPHRGARPARAARLLRRHLPGAARGLRGARPAPAPTPAARSGTWRDALVPSGDVGLADRDGQDWAPLRHPLLGGRHPARGAGRRGPAAPPLEVARPVGCGCSGTSTGRRRRSVAGVSLSGSPQPARRRPRRPGARAPG